MPLTRIPKFQTWLSLTLVALHAGDRALFGHCGVSVICSGGGIQLSQYSSLVVGVAFVVVKLLHVWDVWDKAEQPPFTSTRNAL